eukprot:10274375-Lingulodinium_polyedra.AAC.1
MDRPALERGRSGTALVAEVAGARWGRGLLDEAGLAGGDHGPGELAKPAGVPVAVSPLLGGVVEGPQHSAPPFARSGDGEVHQLGHIRGAVGRMSGSGMALQPECVLLELAEEGAVGAS